MRKRRANLNLVLRGGAVCLALLFTALPGCKKKPAPPPQAEVRPLPQKPVQQNVSAAKQVPAKPAVTPADVKPAGSPPAGGVQPQGKAVVPAAATVPGTVAAKPVAAKPEVQKQVSSARLAPPPAGISLDFTNRRDPFKPYVQAPSPQASTGKTARQLKDALPIQSFDTEKFRVTGIITGIRENSALVLDPNGKGYVVREGMLMGSNDGRIKRITNSTVEVEESYRDDNGRLKKRLVKLALTRKK